MDRASLVYAKAALIAASYKLNAVMLGLCLAIPLLISMWHLYRALSGAEGRRRVRFEPVIKD